MQLIRPPRSVSTKGYKLKILNDETQHIKLLHQLSALLISFKGLIVAVRERWWVVGGAAWGEAFGCCHRHIRAQHQSSPFIRGCLGLSAPPSDESSIIDQTKYIQQPSYHYFSQLGSLQAFSRARGLVFFLKDVELTYIGVHWTKNRLINYKRIS